MHLLRNAFPFLLLILAGSNLPAQNPRFQLLYNLFSEAEFESLHLYSFAHRPGDFRETEIYPFKGRRISPGLLDLFKDHITSIDLNPADSDFYACQRFFLTDTLEVLLVREFHDGGMEHHIHLLMYDNVREHVTGSLKGAHAYGYESGWGKLESYITDLDGDGYLDVLGRKYEAGYSDGNHFELDSITVHVWMGTEWKAVPVTESGMLGNLRDKFPYQEEPRLNGPERDALRIMMKAPEGRSAPHRDWCIVMGEFDQPEWTVLARAKIETVVSMNEKYGLDSRLFYTVERGGKFHVVMRNHLSENEARIAAGELRRRGIEVLGIFPEEEWCPDPELQSNGMYKCVD